MSEIAAPPPRINAPAGHRGWGACLAEHIGELWAHRALVRTLVVRESKARYRGSILGYLWTLLNPLLQLATYTLVFSFYLRVDVAHYPLHLLVALLPWIWTASSLSTGATSLIAGSALITRAMLPPHVLVAMHLANNLLNMLLGLPVLLGAALVVGIVPSPAVVLLPWLVAVQAVFTYGLAVALAALCVRFRDVEFLVQNGLQLWLFLTPIAYPLAVIPEGYRSLALLNPITSLVLPYRDILYAGRAPDPLHLALGAAMAVASLAVGVRVFEALRPSIAEGI